MTVDPELITLSTDLRKALAGVAKITAASRVAFQSGDYERVYIRSEESLAASLLATREILILVTAFRSLQVRTIAMAEQSLREAGGRLEPGMVIVVHLDEQGNVNLRNWGRERGLTVLPICATEGIPKGPDLEQLLCSGLYVHDPFDLAGPVRATGQFFGRTDTPDVARRLRTGNIHGLFGIRKIGKTSVLNRILDELNEFHGADCAMADCSDDSLSALDAGALLSSIAGAIGDAISYEPTRYAEVIPLQDSMPPAEAARTLTNVLSSATRPVVLAFDELDYITPSSPVAPHWRQEFNIFFRALRRVYQECARRGVPFSVVLCGVSSRWFTVEAIDSVENSALAFVPETYLPPLETYHAVEMIQTLGRSAGLVFSRDGARLISETCSDIPYWIRKAGSYIHSCFSQGDRPIKLRYPDLTELVGEFVTIEGGQLAYSSLSHLFRIYPQLAPVAMGALTREDVTRFPQSLVSALGRYGILGVGFEPSGPMVRAGLELWQSGLTLLDDSSATQAAAHPQSSGEDSSLSAVRAGSTSEAGEQEWADLLGEVSRARNVLERTLRDFIAAAIRGECAKATSTRRPVDHVISSVRAERRIELQGRSLAAVLKALYWQELVAVVKKNWAVFEQYFHDRKQLELWAEIINDRPDAHAKEIDGAELALQRRAIAWFEDRIEASELL